MNLTNLAFEVKVMKIVDWPINPECRRLSLEFHAQRARDWWGVWNRCHPMAEVISHFPHPDEDLNSYIMIFDTLENIYIENEDEAILIFARFLLEIELLWDHPYLDGNWDLSFASAGLTGCHAQALPRLVLKPSQVEDDSSTISAKASFVRKAWNLIRKFSKIDLPAIPGRICRRNETAAKESVEWLSNNVGMLKLSIWDTEHELRNFTTPIITLGITSNLENMICIFDEASKGGILKNNLSVLNQYYVRISPLRQRIITLENQPTFPIIIEENLPHIITMTWDSIVTNINNVHREEICKSIGLTLSAEMLDLYDHSIPVELVEDEEISNRGLIAFKFQRDIEHPTWGQMNYPTAVELVDEAFEAGIIEVAINDKSDPFVWSKFEKYTISNSHPVDPNILLVKVSGNRIPPQKGFLKLADVGTRSLINRKRNIVQYASQSVHLRETLTAPEKKIEIKREMTHLHEFGREWRLKSEGPFQLIQGPPGTGKTWTSVRLIEDILRNNPAAKILVCSKEHLALNHLTESIITALPAINNGEHKVVRILSSIRNKAKTEFENMLEHTPEVKGQKYWNRILSSVEETASAEESSFMKKLVKSEEKFGLGWLSEAFLHEASVVCVTTTDQRLETLLRRSNPVSFDFCIIEESGKSYPSEVISALAISRNWILVGDQMQLPPFKLRETSSNLDKCINFISAFKNKRKSKFNDMLSEYLSDLAGVDFAKPLAGEELEEYYQLTRLILQPFKTYYEQLERHGATHFLSEQRRMFKSISNVVGDVFYGKTFDWKKEEEVPIEEMPRIFQEHGRLIVFDTPHCSKNEEWRESMSEGRSLKNEMEAKLVKSVVEQLSTSLKIVVLTPYKGQQQTLKRELADSQHVQVYTTDGYQGKESDIIILSLVRNNTNTGRGRWGFVADQHRLNVALSRAREGLILVTCKDQIMETEFLSDRQHLLSAYEQIIESGTCILATDIRG